jgi:inosine-uridine nucleoside N-ribohydrolase
MEAQKYSFGFTYGDHYDADEAAKLIKRLEKPKRSVDVVLDTDTYNEVDDQYALAYLLQSSDKLSLKALYAAPFDNHHSKSAEDGMLRSYDEIFKVLDLAGRPEYKKFVYKGARAFLFSEQDAQKSAAAYDLIERSQHYDCENPLYVVGIAACTNIASAILLDPTIIERIFVVWLGGLGFDWHDNNSFNASQDIAAARILLGAKVPLVLLPGRGVVDHFSTTGPELNHHLKGRNSFCDYIIGRTADEAAIFDPANICWSRPLSDVTAVAWLLDGPFMLDRLESSPIMEYDRYYSFDNRRHFIRYVYAINRDMLMADLFSKLASL